MIVPAAKKNFIAAPPHLSPKSPRLYDMVGIVHMVHMTHYCLYGLFIVIVITPERMACWNTIKALSLFLS